MVRKAIIIPARYESTRLPGKPLLRETGKYLIQHVCERALEAGPEYAVYVATDDRRIFDAVGEFGATMNITPVMTSTEHTTGTERVAEVARGIDAGIIVNVQGDEPEMSPECVRRVAEMLEETGSGAAMSTLCRPADSVEEFRDPSAVKVVLGKDGRAIYFSRSPIPFWRDHVDTLPEDALIHLGIYGYRRDFLLEFAAMPPARLEQIEKLEQLRALENGRSIIAEVTEYKSFGIDTPDDYKAFVGRYELSR